MATGKWGLIQKNPPAPSRGEGPLVRAEAFLAAQAASWPLWVPVALATGIALWFLLPFVDQRRAALLAALAMALAGLGLAGRCRLALVGAAALVALGLLAAEARSLRVAPPILYHRLAGDVAGEVVALAPWRGAGVRLRLRRDDGNLVQLVSPHAAPDWLVPGARIAVPARFEPRQGPLVPGGHDSFRHDMFNGLSASGRATAPPRLLARAPPPAGPAAALARARQAIGRWLDSTLGAPAGAIASAFALGTQGGIPPELRQSFQVAGLVHLLTVSGFHVGLVAAGLYGLTRRLPLLLAPGWAQRLALRPLAALVAGAGAWAYVLLSGAEVPAVRAGVMATLVLAGLALGRDPLSARLLALAAFLILLLRPEVLLSASFQLSFAAVATLVLLARLWPPADSDAGAGQRVGRWIALLLASSLAIELVLLPIAAAHFGRAGLYGVLANALAIPLASFAIMPLLGLHLLLWPLGLAALTGPPLVLALDLFAAIATHVAALPGAALAIPAVPRAAAIAGVAGALLLALLQGRARLAGAPLLALALALQLGLPRPDIFVSPDGQQLGVLARDGTLYLARGRGESLQARSLAEATAARRILPLARFPGAACSQGGCALVVGDAAPLRLLVITATLPLAPAALARACREADLVVAPWLPQECRPAWHRLDRAALAGQGATAIVSSQRRLTSAGQLAGDHYWSPAALPGVQQRLLGGPRWIAPLAW